MRRMKVRVNGQWYEVEVGDVYQSPVEVMVNGDMYLVELGSAAEDAEPVAVRILQEEKGELPGLRGILQGSERVVRSPLPGKVVSVSVTKGQEVGPGDEICVLESMKMEQSVRMAHHGLVKTIKIKQNQSINTGAPLLELQ